MQRPRVILADNHFLLLDAFRNLLEVEFDVVGTFTDGRSLVEGAAALTPDVIVMDTAISGMHGLMAGRRLKELIPKVKIIYLATDLDPEVAGATFRFGASAYLGKNARATELVEAIRLVLAGGTYITALVSEVTDESLVASAPRKPNANSLTCRQEEVLKLLSEGQSMKEVAFKLNITPRTVAYHKYTMMKDLRLQNSAELFRFAFQHSLTATA